MKIEVTQQYSIKDLIDEYENLGAEGIYALGNKLEVRPPY